MNICTLDLIMSVKWPNMPETTAMNNLQDVAIVFPLARTHNNQSKCDWIEICKNPRSALLCSLTLDIPYSVLVAANIYPYFVEEITSMLHELLLFAQSATLQEFSRSSTCNCHAYLLVIYLNILNKKLNQTVQFIYWTRGKIHFRLGI